VRCGRFILAAAGLLLCGLPDLAAADFAVEWGVTATRQRPDSWNEIELDAVVRNTAGQTWRVPGYWAGGTSWRFRFPAEVADTYEFRTECSDPADSGLHGQTGRFVVAPRRSKQNPLLAHGSIRLSDDRRHFVHADGTPFFWLADQWWFAMSSRLRYPEDFNLLVRDRVAKGFSVIGFAIAFPCDIAPFDPRG
jgi:hypothetical protein